MTRTVRIGWLLLALLACGAVALVAGRIVAARETARLAAAAGADARLRQALLDSEIARFRLLPLAMADDRDLRAALSGTATARRTLDRKLEGLVRRTGAAVIYVIGADGRAIAASNWRTPTSFVGNDYRFRRYVIQALAGGAGEQFARGTVSGRPGLYLARRAGAGVVVVKLEFDRLERAWRQAGGITFATDPAGVVVVTSRPDWRFAVTRPLAPAQAAAIRADAAVRTLRPVPYRVADGRLIPRDGAPSIAVDTPADATGWRVHLAVPAMPVDRAARAARTLGALAAAGLIALGWAIRERARRRALRTATLEAAVTARTAALSHEIEERTAAEARAAELREGLRQANRLATLGQITAGLAHETAQPVAAIRTYTANAGLLLDRGDTDAVRGNLSAIARLADRIGTVTAELRGFARKRPGEVGPVPLAEVIDGARLLLKERLAGIALTLPDVPPDLAVRAGRVRLEQVLVNLMQNAVEALDGVDRPALALSLTLEADAAVLVVADNGPGIARQVADQLFTPFTTSRATGLGLGLVIAQDIMADLGGSLRLLPDGPGARFAVTIPRA